MTSSTELPWDLAEKYLGSGQRWQDIAALNPDVPGLASGDQYLPKGAVIKLPRDARPTTPSTTPGSTSAAASHNADTVSRQDANDEKTSGTTHSSELGAPRHDHVTVDAGDSLWSIADDEYGDPTAWKEIYEANKGESQPGEATSTTPT
ncbi:LysM peptidoglycan-binding domain-containing protein [Streptomyces chiangmaiensis]